MAGSRAAGGPGAVTGAVVGALSGAAYESTQQILNGGKKNYPIRDGTRSGRKISQGGLALPALVHKGSALCLAPLHNYNGIERVFSGRRVQRLLCK